jgi:hypothetical protein
MNRRARRDPDNPVAVFVAKLVASAIIAAVLYFIGHALTWWSTPTIGWIISALIALVLVFAGKFLLDEIFDGALD